jgi:diacylglycerol O-acyltransferase
MTTQEHVLAAAAEWSGGDRMSELETTMWRSERHPQQSSTVCSLMILDRSPEWERFVAAHEWAVGLVPRFRQHVVEPLLPTQRPTWTLSTHFTLSYHLRRVQLGDRNTMGDLLEHAQQMAMTPFDRTRPLWEGTLFEGLEGGQAAYLLKLHHSLTDGLGAIQLLSLVQSRTPEHTPDKPVGPAALESGLEEPDPLSLTVEGVRDTLRSTPALIGAGLSAGRQILADPMTAASEGLRFAASLRRVLSPSAEPSPLLRPRNGRSWQFMVLECPLADLRTAGKSAGGSVNDAYIAALLGGLRRYHEHHGVEIDELPVTVPVSLRSDEDPMGGNRFAGAMFASPIGVEDPAERIAALRGVILSQLIEPALDSVSLVAPVVNRMPSAVGAAAIGHAFHTDLSASNVPGISHEVFMAGARVEKLYPFGPLPGVAVMAAMVSHVGTCCIGLNVDGSAIEDLDTLQTCMQAGLDEVLSLAI